MKEKKEEKQYFMRLRWKERREKELAKERKLAQRETCWRLTKSERKVFSMVQDAGHYDIIRNGWPDFGVVVDGKLVGIEVKSRHDDLRADQTNTHRLLKMVGIDVVVIYTDDPLEVTLNKLRDKISN